jgi:hypothetical protein
VSDPADSPASSGTALAGAVSAGVFGAFLGLNVSAWFKSAVTVYILLPLLLLPQMLLGGLIISFDDLRARTPRRPIRPGSAS